jgi:hypothetical protein
MTYLNRFHSAIFLALLFIFGTTAALLWFLLMDAQGLQPWFYFLLVVNLLAGGAALILGITGKNEIIVYREKTTTDNQNKDTTRNENGGDSLNLVALDQVIQQAKSPLQLMEKSLHFLARELQAGAGAFYRVHHLNGTPAAVLEAGYAIPVSEKKRIAYEAGDGLIGQILISGQSLYLDEIPDGYIKIHSGLGSASPRYIFISPVRCGDEICGVIEMASFTPYTPQQRKQIEEATRIIGEKIKNL